MKNLPSINPLFEEAVSYLASQQTTKGEFETHAINQQGESFYIGESPFITSHIICLLSDISNSQVTSIKQCAIDFLLYLKDNNLGLYKFWYKHTFGTAFARLPYDMDDSAVVNQALWLNDIKNHSIANLIQENTNKSGHIYTWWRPPVLRILKAPTQCETLFSHFSSYLIFKLNKDGLKMAEYEDSEIIVRLNCYMLFEILNKPYSFPESFIPVSISEVRNELRKSLHYINEAVYYYTLSRFHHSSKKLSNTQLNQLKSSVRELIEEWKNEDSKISSILLLYLSLSYLENLNEIEISEVLTLVIDKHWKNYPIMVCVGNKRFKNYHQYYSKALSWAVAANLLDKIRLSIK